MTHDTQEVMNIVYKFQPPSSNGLGVFDVLKIWRKSISN